MDINKNDDKPGINGVFVVTLAFLLWGILPLYWNALSNVSAMTILANRISGP